MKTLAPAEKLAALALSVAVFVLASTTPASAQDRIRFKPAEHLEGYEEAQASPYELLYDFAPFEEDYGEFVSTEVLADLQKDWGEQHARIQAEIQKIETDAKEAGVFELRKKLRDHRFFQVVDYTRLDGPADLVFLVQGSLGDSKGYEQRMVDYYGSWLSQLEEIWRREYVEPLGLERRADHPTYAICVLSSTGLYRDYADAVRSPGLYLARAHYDHELRLAVTHTDPFGREEKSLERRAALHELVHAFQDSYHTLEDARMPVWFAEGLAEYLSAHEGVVPEALEAHPLDEDALALFQQLATQRQIADVLLLPLEELAGLADYAAALKHFEQRGREHGGLLFPAELSMGALYAQSGLWMHYLHRGEGGKYEQHVLRYADLVLAGKGSVDDLRAAFEGVELTQLDRGFRRFVNGHLDARGAKLAPAPEHLSGWEPPAVAAEDTVTASYSPGSLAPDASDPEVGLVLALAKASEGRFTEAAAELRVLLEAGGLDAERLQRELERLDGMVTLRRDFLGHLLAQGKKLNLQLAAGRLLVLIEEVDDERVRLGSNRHDIEALPLDDIDGVQLAALMRDKRKYGFEAKPAWLLAYPYVLNGDDAWRKLLRSGGPEADALAEDARSDYPQRMATALAARDLVRLNEAGAPGTLQEAGSVVATIEALLARSAAEELVKAKLPELAGLASAAYVLEFEAQGLAQVLSGALEEKRDGSLRLVYEFEDPAELADFVNEPLHDDFNQGVGQRTFSPFTVNSGYLSGNGFSSAKHVLSFRSRTRFSCKFRLRAPTGSYNPAFLIFFGLCDDGYGSFVWSRLDGSLQVVDLDENFAQRADSRLAVLTEEQWYTLEIVHDGEETITTTRNGKDGASVSCGPRKEGSLFLWSSCDLRFEVDRIEIEGTVVPASLEALRAGWVEERLQALGL